MPNHSAEAEWAAHRDAHPEQNVPHGQTIFTAGFDRGASSQAAQQLAGTREAIAQLSADRSGGVGMLVPNDHDYALADALLASGGPLADAKKVWDQGYRQAEHERFDGVYDGNPSTSPNPYRESRA